ncbi:hypothetical protein ACOSP7_024832 [Xanthoceras sorbifolium]
MKNHVPFGCDAKGYVRFLKDCGCSCATKTAPANGAVSWGDSGNETQTTENVQPICLDEFSDRDDCMVGSTCKHIFHKYCIDEWILKNKHCPLCRGAPVRLQMIQCNYSPV